MGRTSRNARAGLVVPAAVIVASERAGELAAPLRDRVLEGAGELADRTAPLRDRVVESAGELAETAAPLVESAVETVSGVLEEALERGGAAWVALRGDRVGPPVAVRRWPWALGAAVAGATAGAVVAALVRRLSPQDAPGAQEPHELRAVVDTEAPPAPTPAPMPDGGAGTGTPAPAPPVASPTFRL